MEIILGTWALHQTKDRSYYGGVELVETEAIFDLAWQSGIRRIDLAWQYGNGESIKRLASWQKARNQRFSYALKVGRIETDNAVVSNLTKTKLEDEIKIVSGLLGPPKTLLIKDPPEDLFVNGELNDLLDWVTKTHKNTQTGIATHQLNSAKLLPKTKSKIVQLEYNGINAVLAAPVARELREKGYMVWGMQPLCYGFLSGNYSIGHKFQKEDWRSKIDKSKVNLFVNAANVFDKNFLVSMGQYDLALKALLFCFASPVLDAVIVGPKSTKQLESCMHGYRISARKDIEKEVHEKIKVFCANNDLFL